MRHRFIALCAVSVFGCSSSEFGLGVPADDVGTADGAGGADTVAPDTTPGDVGAGDTRPVDAAPPPDVSPDVSPPDVSPPPDAIPPIDGGPPCDSVTLTTTTVYVDNTAPAGGKGTASCPFRTLAEAAASPLGAGVVRTVSVRTGVFFEVTPIKIRGGETYRSDGSGPVKVVGNGTASCGIVSSDSCTMQLDAGSTLDGFTLDGGTAANGLVTIATTTPAPVVKNTTVKNMPKDGIVVTGSGASFGPNTRADTNGWSGVMLRGGQLNVNGTGNGFDGNKGGYYLGGTSTYVAGSGIHVLKGAGLFVDGGCSANNNHTGVFFDAGGGSGTQTLSQLTAVSNRSSGVFIAKGWKATVRKCYLNKNAQYGLMLSYDGVIVNPLDLGVTGSLGANIFANTGTKNGKGAIFLCRSPKTGVQVAEGDTWTSCAPTQVQVANCDAMPTSYADVVYSPEASGTEYVNPVAVPSTCTSS